MGQLDICFPIKFDLDLDEEEEVVEFFILVFECAQKVARSEPLSSDQHAKKYYDVAKKRMESVFWEEYTVMFKL